jgi:V-type H+-transporting ATPase subunit E
MAEDSNASLEDYVFLEAKERCYEIEIKALKEFEKEKARILEKEKESINEDFEKKLRAKEAEYKM